MDSAEREGLRPKGNVPNLRFPEFQGEWEKCTLGNNVKIQGGYAFKSELFLRKGIPIIRISNLPQNASFVDLDDCTYYKEGNYNSFEVHNGDLLIAMSGATTGKTAIYNKKTLAYLNQRVGLFKSTNSDSLYYPFLYAFVSTPVFKRQLSTRLIAGAQPNISSSDIESIRISIPQKTSEQEKIAHLMLLLDKRIAAQNKIINKLQSLIKGIVDCTILRKEKNAIVADVCSISEQIRAEANIDDIITVRLHGRGVCKSSAENLQLGATQYYRRRAGQLIYGKQNFHNGAIGIVPQSLDNGITSKDIPSFDIYDMKCNSVYLLAQLQSPQYYKPAEALTTGTGSKRLKEDTFLKMPIVLPDKREQDKIATLIFRISANLDQAKKVLDLFSIQKQYLLRQMFI